MFNSIKVTKTVKSPSPKKGNVAEIAARMLIALDFKAKNVQQDIVNWNETLPEITAQVEKIEQVVKVPNPEQTQTLLKSYQECTAALQKLNKSIESSQKRFNKAIVEFESKLLLPFNKGNYSSQAANLIEQAKASILKIQEVIALNKQPLEQIVDKVMTLTRRTVAVEAMVNQLCLPDQLDDALKVNEGLNQRLQAINLAAATMQLSQNINPQDTKKSEEKFVTLYRAHLSNKALLDQIGKDLKVPNLPQIQASNGLNL